MSASAGGPGGSAGAGAGVEEQGGELTGHAQEQAQGVPDPQALADQAKVRARDEVERRSDELGSRMSATADDLRDVADHLRLRGKGAPARVLDQAAERVSGAGDYLRETDGDRLLHDAETLARQRPWAAVTGGAALGLAMSRFLKASSTQRYRSSAGAPPQPTAKPRASAAATGEAPPRPSGRLT